MFEIKIVLVDRSSRLLLNASLPTGRAVFLVNLGARFRSRLLLAVHSQVCFDFCTQHLRKKRSTLKHAYNKNILTRSTRRPHLSLLYRCWVCRSSATGYPYLSLRHERSTGSLAGFLLCNNLSVHPPSEFSPYALETVSSTCYKERPLKLFTGTFTVNLNSWNYWIFITCFTSSHPFLVQNQ